MADVQLSTLGGVIKTAYEGEGNVVAPAKTADYTLALADLADIIPFNSASNLELTIPANATAAFPLGTYALILRKGTGNLTIQAAAGVTLTGNGGGVAAGSCTVQTRYTSAALLKIATDEWHVQGDISAVA